MKEAYANSCNTYFYALAKETGYEEICYTARRMGIGEETAAFGLAVKEADFPKEDENHTDAYLANMAIGQGDMLLSPFDVMKITLCAVSGEKAEFSLVKKIIYPSESVGIENKKEKKRVLCDETVEKLAEMMRFCVTDGTGFEAYDGKINTSGKTATAQSGQYKDGKEVLHRWFAGFFPSENPVFAVVVFCDGHGENNATPSKIFLEIAKRIQS